MTFPRRPRFGVRLSRPERRRDYEAHPGSGIRDPRLRVRDGLGLVVQGGGMRGAFAMGALAEMEHAGLTAAFDVAVGNSAGAIALAYFVAGQSATVEASYWQELRAARVFNPWRVWRIVDVDRMVEDAMNGANALDFDDIRGSRTRFLIGLTDATFRLPAYVLASDLDKAEFGDALRASAALPGLYNRRVGLRGRDYVDGGFVDTLPLLRLLVLGCTRTVVVCTSPLDYTFVRDGLARRLLIKAFSRGQGRLIRSWIGTPNPLHDENLEALLSLGADPERGGVLPIAPARRLPDFVSDTSELQQVFDEGRLAAAAALATVPWFGAPGPPRRM